MEWQISDRLSCAADPFDDPVPMQQHAYYGAACTAIGSRVQLCTLGPAHAPRSRAQVLLRRWPLVGDVAMIVRGPVWARGTSAPEARSGTEALIALLRRRCRCVMLSCEPVAGQDPMAGAGLLPMVTPRSQARLTLGPTQALMARQHGKWRNRLRRAQDGPLSVQHTPLPEEADHWLLLREAAQAKRRGYRPLPMQFTRAWRAVNGATSTRLFVARYRKAPVAAMLFLLHGRGASYHIGWTDELGRSCHAHNLLLFEAARWLAARGHGWIDLGTLDTETTPGLARFKLGSGAEKVSLGATCLSAPASAGVARLCGHGARPLKTPLNRSTGCDQARVPPTTGEPV